MSTSYSTKRANKRSLVGLRVAAKRDSGFYEAGSIVDTTSKAVVASGADNLTSAGSSSSSSSLTCLSSSSGHNKVLISFDDGTKHWYAERHVVGPGFQGPTSASLTIGQTVYCTVGHRETPGKIRTLPSAGGEVFQVSLEDGSGQVITRKQEDMRLIKSRKSNRGIPDKDYHSLASGKTDFDLTLADTARELQSRASASSSRKRAVPMDIVQNTSNRHHQIHQSSKSQNTSKLAARTVKSDRDLEDELLYAPLINEFVDVDSEESLGEMDEGDDSQRSGGHGELMMDECSAALVLMSLGASPATRTLDNMQDDAGFSSSSFPGGFASSWPVSGGVDRLSRSLHQAEVTRHHSPGASLHDSTTASSSDEGIEVASSMQIDPCHLDHDYSAWAEPPEWTLQNNPERPKKRRPSNSVVTFQCTWPKCQHMEPSRTGIKRHIQNVHFTSAGLPAEDLEFYYNEIDGSDDVEEPTGKSMPWAWSPLGENKNKPSHISNSLIPGRHRHRSTLSQSSDNSIMSSFSMPKPIAIPRTSQRFSNLEWESASAPQTAGSMGFSDGFSTVSSSFGSGISKKIRDIKKCRKVYGMDNREMWCTQCKWKKACTRFSTD